MTLARLLVNSAQRSPSSLAVHGCAGEASYGELDALSNRFAHGLGELGVRRGARVGVWMEKSVVSIAAMQGALRLGAIYVPIDPLNPVARVRSIVDDCDMTAVVTDRPAEACVLTEGPRGSDRLIVSSKPYEGLPDLHWVEGLSSEGVLTPCAESDIAYVLYTSGSTGTPKGVCITHRNAEAFIEWAVSEVGLRSDDRLSSHAPFHFDLSVFDLYGAFTAVASIHLIDAGMAYSPAALVELIAKQRLSVWYSVPTVIVQMMQQAALLDRLERLALRVIIFAGEPFPIHALRSLRAASDSLRLLNFYGPTETNVCTFFDVTGPVAEDAISVPIGSACSGDTVWAVAPQGQVAEVSQEGVLHVQGPTVMHGYWGFPPHGNKPYVTGDLVKVLEDGVFAYVGRADGMVKVRGHRIELGDVEAALSRHPKVREAAALVAGGNTAEARLVGVVAVEGDEMPTLLEMKRLCAERLPRYMIIDRLRCVSALPRTRNGKVDRRRLAEDYGELA